MVQSSVIFGRGRFQAGVLIEPKPEHAFDPEDLNGLSSFRDVSWYVLRAVEEVQLSNFPDPGRV